MKSLRSQLPFRQKGMVTIVAAILFLVIVGYAAVMALNMGGSQVTDAALIRSEVEAQFLAEAGLERAFYDFKTGTLCTTLAPSAPISLGNGSFTITAASLVGASTNCRITAIGKIGLVVSQMIAVATPGGYNFWEPFPSGTLPDSPDVIFKADWFTNDITRNQGEIRFDNANCPATTPGGIPGGACFSSIGGSMLAYTSFSFSTARLWGYRQRQIPVINTGSGLSISYSLAFKKLYFFLKPSQQKVSLTLFDTSSGLQEVIWQDNSKSSANTWNIVTGNAISLVPGRQYDQIRVEFQITSRFISTGIWVDEIHITSP